MSGWKTATVESVHTWAPGLATLRLDATLAFTAGQFVSLALEVDGERLSRSYSMSSAPGDPLEFFLTRVEGGALSPRLLHLAKGDRLELNPLPAGHFTLARIPEGDVLWLLATGTGLGPYLSILRTEAPWERFEKIVVVHGVRCSDHLAYREELAQRSAAHGGALTWVPVVSREPEATGVLRGRLTTALEDGSLEAHAGARLGPSSQVMLCGNPAMIRDARALLEARGLARNRPRAPGQITMEKYWGG